MASKQISGTRKVTVGRLSGSIAIIVVWIIETTTTLSIPPQVTTVFGSVLTAVAFYFTPEYYYQIEEE